MTAPRCLLIVAVFCLSHTWAAAQTWAHERSNLPPDPAVHWGVLPNGFRYAIRQNAEPQGRISLRFIVQAGSLDERDDERGLAHFVEHMAFRSTRDHPDGSLINELQRLGIGWGPENTAFTTFDYTIYHLDLPDDKASTLQEGLSVFREYADGIVFKPAEIDTERGVVLSEMAMRNTPDARAGQANLDFVLPRSRQSERAPIGLEAQIRQFTAAQFKGFYDAWYRPDRMILSVVGTLDPARVEDLIKSTFGPLQARGPARPDPPAELTSAPATEDTRIFTDPSTVGVALLLQHAVRHPEHPNTLEDYTQNLHTALALSMLQQRLGKMAQRRGTSFISPRVTMNSVYRGWRVATLSLPGKILAWRLLVADAEQELRRALEFGFTASELHEAKKNFTTYYEQGVRSEATIPSPNLATSLAAAIAHDEVFSDARTIQRTMQGPLDRATLADCLQALREAWGREPPKLFINANAGFNVTAREVANAYNYSRRVEVLPPVERPVPAFAYTHFGPTGTLVQKQHLEDLDLWLTQFANGVRFNFKTTHYEADTVLVSLRVGTGRLSQPRNQPGLDLLANYGLLAGGLGKHTNAELSDILNGHVISLRFGVESDTFAFSLRCAPRELQLGLQIITAILTDSAYRPVAMRNARANYGSLSESLSSTPGGPIFANAPRVLTSGDQRFGIPNLEVLARRTLPELRAWVVPQFTHGPIELSVVGDIDLPTAEQAVASTLGALPARPAPADDQDRGVKTPRPSPQPMNSAVSAQLRQSAMAYFWPMPDLRDVHTERRCRLLASILEDRLRQRVREELGASYSLSSQFVQTEGFPTFNYFQTYAEVEPSRTQEVDRIIRREIAAMRREGLTRDEFERAKQPFISRRSADLRNNVYWGYTVLRDAQQRPARIAAARDRTADTAAITLPEVQQLLDRYIDPSAVFAFRTAPLGVNARSPAVSVSN